jgi:hypothetical protein
MAFVPLVILGLVATVLGVTCGSFGGPVMATWAMLVGGLMLAAMAILGGLAPPGAAATWLRSYGAVLTVVVVLTTVAFALN